MKVSGLLTKQEQVEENVFLQMVLFMMVIGWRGSHLSLEDLYTKMDLFMKDWLKKAKNMAKEF